MEHVLQQARENLSGVFGYTDESRQVGITGSVELGEVEGGCVVLRFAGRFWHRRSDVVSSIACLFVFLGCVLDFFLCGLLLI